MLDIKNVDIKIDSEATKTLGNFIKKTWTGIPKWLRTLFVVTVACGALYFLYNRISISYDIELLENEVKELDERFGVAVFYDRYVYDINNVITTVKTFEKQLDLLYVDHINVLEDFERFAQRNCPHDPILSILKTKKAAMESEYNAYKNIIEHQIDIYEHNDEFLNRAKQKTNETQFK